MSITQRSVSHLGSKSHEITQIQGEMSIGLGQDDEENTPRQIYNVRHLFSHFP